MPHTSPNDLHTAPSGGRSGRASVHALSAGGLAVLSLTANLLGYGFFLILNRSQSAADIGMVTAILNVSIITGVPALAAQLVSARRVARLPRTPDTSDLSAAARASLRTGAVLGLGTGFVMALISPLVASLLHLPSTGSALLLAAMLPATGVMYGVQGFLQGRRRFLAFGLIAVLAAGTRALAAASAALMSLGGLALLELTVLAAWLSALVALAVVARETRPRPTEGGHGWVRESLVACASSAVVIVIANIDTPLARHLLDETSAGQYAVLSVFTKAAFWGPAFLATLFFPVMARSASRRHALLAVGSTAGIAVCAIVSAAAFADPLMAIVGGSVHSELAPLVPLFTAVGALWSVSQIVVYWGLARGEQASGYAAWLVVVVVVILALLAPATSPQEIAQLLAVGAIAHTVLGIVLLVVQGRKGPRIVPPREAFIDGTPTA